MINERNLLHTTITKTQFTMYKTGNGKSGKSVLVNGLNKVAILGGKEQMMADPNLGACVPFSIKAVWDKGVVHQVGGKMVCHPPPEIAKGEIKYPTLNSFCPLVSTGCFGLIFMMQAAERDMQFESFQMRMAADANLCCFYRMCADDLNPWSHGVKLDLEVKGPYTETDLQMLTKLAEEHCPSVEIMRRAFPVEVIVEGKEVEMAANEPLHYDMDKYTKIAKEKGPHMVKQSIKGDWYCHNESKEYPDSLMKFVFDEEGGAELPMSHDWPVASGKWATPVQACFFGGLSQHMHTVAARLYASGYLVRSIKGTFSTEMNERILMSAEKKRRYIFPTGGTMELKIESNAPRGVLDQVQFEAEHMSPAFMNWSNDIPIHVRITKQE